MTTTVPVQTSGAPPGTAGAPITLQTTGGDSQVTVSWAPPATTGAPRHRLSDRVVSQQFDLVGSFDSGNLALRCHWSYEWHGDVFPCRSNYFSWRWRNFGCERPARKCSSAPLGLTGTFTGSTLTLSWSLPADAGGSTNLSIIERSTDGGDVGLRRQLGRCRNSDDRWCRCGCRNPLPSVGPKFVWNWSGTVVSVTGPTPTAVSAVQNLSSVSTAAGATVSWAAPAVTGAATVNGYKVERSANGSTWTVISVSQTALARTSLASPPVGQNL